MIASFDGSAGYFLSKILGKTNGNTFVVSPGDVNHVVRFISYLEIKYSELFANHTNNSTFSSISSFCNVYSEYVNKYVSSVAYDDKEKYSQCRFNITSVHQENQNSSSIFIFNHCTISTKIYKSANCSCSSYAGIMYSFFQDHKNLVKA